MSEALADTYTQEFVVQLQALSRSSREKVAILSWLSKREKATLREIASELFPGRRKSSVQTFLQKLEEGKLVCSTGKRPRSYSLDQKGLGALFARRSPSIRDSLDRRTKSWDSSKMMNTLTRLLVIEPEVARDIARRVEQILVGTSLTNVSFVTLRYLICEVLYERQMLEQYYEYLPIGIGKEKAEEVTTRKLDEVHTITIGEYLLKLYMLRQMPKTVLRYLQSGEHLYIHGLRSLFMPLNLVHNLRPLLLEGITIPNIHVARPAQHLSSALSHVLALLGFARSDCDGSQTIDHFNYYMSPFVAHEKRISGMTTRDFDEHLSALCDSFIMDLFRKHITNTFDRVYSGLTIDLDLPRAIANDNVIFSGQFESETYADFSQHAEILATVFLDTYREGFDQNLYYFPKLFLGLTAENIPKLRESQVGETIFETIRKAPTRPIYMIQRGESDVAYVTDLTRVVSERDVSDPSSKMRAHGCMLAVTPNLLNLKDDTYRKGISGVVEEMEKRLNCITDIAVWKSKRVRQLSRDNKLRIIGNSWRSCGESYLDLGKSTVDVRLFGLRRVLDKLQLRDENERFEEVRNFLQQLSDTTSRLSKEFGLNFRVGQTGSQSGARRFDLERRTDSKFLFHVIETPPQDEDEFRRMIREESVLQKMLPGGALTYLVFSPRSYTKVRFWDDVESCFSAGIQLLGFERGISRYNH